MYKKIPISKENYYKAALTIINPLGLNLTPFELDLLSVMLQNSFFVLTRATRKTLRGIIDSDQFTFNNYIKRLKDKGILVSKGSDLIVNEALVEQLEDKEIHIVFETNDS